MRPEILTYIAVMALVTYLIRLLPLTLIRRRITNKYIRSFLYYVPYATLSAMTAAVTADALTAGAAQIEPKKQQQYPSSFGYCFLPSGLIFQNAPPPFSGAR